MSLDQHIQDPDIIGNPQREKDDLDEFIMFEENGHKKCLQVYLASSLLVDDYDYFVIKIVNDTTQEIEKEWDRKYTSQAYSKFQSEKKKLIKKGLIQSQQSVSRVTEN